MLKWIIFASIALIVVVLVIKIIKVMLKTEKESKQKEAAEPIKEEEYKPEQVPADMRSSSAGIVTDMSNNVNDNNDTEYDFDMSGFSDHDDEEFFDYSSHMHNHKNRKRKNMPDVDLDGEFADDFEYQPTNFDYLTREPRRQNKKKPVSTELNELSTELKVLMLSDIFDRKFFD